MRASLQTAVAQALGSPVRDARSVTGGDINDAYQVKLQDERVVFVKSARGNSDPQMFQAEARGLAWLAEAGAIRVPGVLEANQQFLVLENIVSGRPRPDYDELLGRSLSALHRFGAPGFGLDHDNFIGRLPQSNRTAATWAEFYRAQRLEPQVELARAQGLCSSQMLHDFDHLFAVLEDRVGPPEPPARLHGDLWGGNVMVDEAGLPCLIDPAVYGGHREVDLAMMRLFGGFGSRVFAAYQESWPLSPGHEERIPLYQLYFLMVHVNLFGGSYVASAERALAQVV